MFYYGYNNYLKYSFPKDELRPITCRGTDTFGSYALTFIDSLDSLVVFGNMTEFERGVNWVIDNIHFDKNITVSVFETNIRVLGGLLSSHLIAERHLKNYDGRLLKLSLDLGMRLLPAFDTPTGIPYGAINLKYGVAPDETPVTCTASGGTFSLEFGVLSKLTGIPDFEQAARKAIRSLWAFRSPMDLVGNHINIVTGEWTIKESGIGTGIDSFFEYLLKSAIYFDDQEYMDIFLEAYGAILKHVKKDPWYVDVSINNGAIIWPIYNSLQSFWPGLQSMFGEYEDGFTTVKAFHAVWRRYGFIPEGYNLISGNVQPGQKGYPLRPELAESLYYLYKASRDPIFIKMAKDMVWSLNNISKCECGYANIIDVESHMLSDQMESFFLSETCKYLYLLFCDDPKGHVFPIEYRFMEKSKQQLKNNKQSKIIPRKKPIIKESITVDHNNIDKDKVTVDNDKDTKNTQTIEENINNSNSTIVGSNDYQNFNWKCKPLSYLRRISAGTVQFIGGKQEIEWFQDRKILEAMQFK
eukprot:gene5766-7175_t